MKPIASHLGRLLTEAIKLLTSKKRVKQLWGSSLYSNALYLIMANAGGALLGFVFWIVVARFYSPEDVGLASALIAAAILLTGFSQLGLGIGLIRFLPDSKNASSMINTVFTIGILTSIVAAFIFIAGLDFWSPALLFLRRSSVCFAAFVLFTIAYTLGYLADQTFIAKRRAGFVLIKGIIAGVLKLAMPIPLAVFFHSFGIFASWGVPQGVALLVSVFLFLPRAQIGYRPSFAFDRETMNDILRFSSANYVGVLLWSAPALTLSIMVVNLLGAEPNAYFYIAWTVAGVLTMIPNAVSFSLFVEGSYEEEGLVVNVWRSLKMIFLILVPAVILILAIADKLLLLFSGPYSENATMLLRILTISALPLAINLIYLAILRVEKKLKTIVVLAAFSAAVTLGLAYLLLPKMGINGAGIAWLATQGTIALVVVASWLKGRRAISKVNVPISET